MAANPSEGEVGGMTVVWLPLRQLKPYANNPRSNRSAIPKVAESIRRFGWRQPIVVDEHFEIVAGHTRWEAAQLLGQESVPVHVARDLTPELAAAYRIADNRVAAEAVFDQAKLAEELKKLKPNEELLESLGFNQEELRGLIRDKLSESYENWTPGALARDYVVPPLSVLDARQGYWRQRRAWWEEQIGERFAHATREDVLNSGGGGVMADGAGSSVLDPVLCEVLCLWFARPGYRVLNPFAGGVQFGFVAARMGLDYTGVELRPEQVDANNAALAAHGLKQGYVLGDATECGTRFAEESFDFLFSCPPYADLEHYSEDPRDLSNMEHEKFLAALEGSLRSCAKLLKPNRFAALVLGEARGEDGGMLGIVECAQRAMRRAGLKYWNELVLVQPNGTLALRTRGPFESTRKVLKQHQWVLVYYKGEDERQIREEFPSLRKEPEPEPPA